MTRTFLDTPPPCLQMKSSPHKIVKHGGTTPPSPATTENWNVSNRRHMGVPSPPCTAQAPGPVVRSPSPEPQFVNGPYRTVHRCRSSVWLRVRSREAWAVLERFVESEWWRVRLGECVLTWGIGVTCLLLLVGLVWLRLSAGGVACLRPKRMF